MQRHAAPSSFSCSSDAHSLAALLTLLSQACSSGLALHKKRIKHECPLAYLQEHNTVVLPHKASRLQEVSYLIKVEIIKRFEFTSQAMKSGTVVVPEDAPDDTALLLVKGAPSVIKHMAKPGSVPDNFDRVTTCWLSYGEICCNVLRCAVLKFAVCAVLCCAVLCCAVLCCTGLCSSESCRGICACM